MKKIFLFVAVLLAFASCNTQRSHDNIVLLSDESSTGSSVFLTKNEAGIPAVSWAETDSATGKHFYFALWDSISGRFGQKISIPILENAKLHEEGMPKIAFKGDGTIIATMETSLPPAEGQRFGKGDIKFVSSKDGGKTWTEPVSVQAGFPDPGSIGFSNVLRLDDGEIGIAWLGTGPASIEGRPVMFAKTTEEGGFTRGVIVDSVACQCCRIALSTNGDNQVQLAFRNLLPGQIRDISIARSENNGHTFARSVSFSDDQWVIEGCPHDGPALASNGDKTFATWYAGSSTHEGAGVYYAELDKDDNTLLKKQMAPTGKFIQLCLMPDGTRMMGYNESYKDGDSIYNKIVVAKTDGKGFFIKELTEPGARGFYPMVMPVSKNRVLVAWKDEGRVFYRAVNTADITEEMPGEYLNMPMTNATTVKKIKVSNEVDPVCYMRLKDQMAEDTTMVDGKIIGFCSSECKGIFKKDL